MKRLRLRLSESSLLVLALIMLVMALLSVALVMPISDARNADKLAECHKLFPAYSSAQCDWLVYRIGQ